MTSLLLAQALGPFAYVNGIKIGVAIVLLFAWTAGVQWVDRDATKVKTHRENWNMIVLAGGVVAFLVLFLPPWSGGLFALGVTFWVLVAGGALVAYIIHRNSRVMPNARMLTVGHAKRLLTRGGGRGRKKAVVSKGQRVRLTDHAGKIIEVPTDPEETVDFDAVQDFLFDALWRRASDVEMVAGKEKHRIVYRVDGMASEASDGLPLETGERVFRCLKGLAGLNVDEIRRPQTGRIQCALLGQTGDMGETKVRTSGTMAGERLSLQIQSEVALMRITDLGLAPPRLDSVKRFLGKSHGLLIVSAPPQHGMTSTQYAIVRSHDAYINNIHSLERRKLLDLDNITQQVFEGSNTDVDYARMLQTVLRREPDIVLVGDCEDRDTARVATRAAAEDRKIYLGLTAKDSFDALSKYLDLVGSKELAAKAVLGVINQRLVRILCKECREAFTPDAAMLKKLNLPADKIERFYRPPSEKKVDRKGRPILCNNCRGSGYLGRAGVFEVLVVDPAVTALIKEGASINRIKAQCRKNRMYYLQEEALLKVIDGTTSMNEILRCIGAGGK